MKEKSEHEPIRTDGEDSVETGIESMKSIKKKRYVCIYVHARILRVCFMYACVYVYVCECVCIYVCVYAFMHVCYIPQSRGRTCSHKN